MINGPRRATAELAAVALVGDGTATNLLIPNTDSDPVSASVVHRGQFAPYCSLQQRLTIVQCLPGQNFIVKRLARL